MAAMPRPVHPFVPRAWTYLAEADPHLARALETVGPPPKRATDPGFPSLCRSLMAQQISAAAARSIWKRFEASLGQVTPAAVLEHDDEGLRAYGLSRPKVKYLRALAQAAQDGHVRFDAHAAMDDEAIITELVAVPGIGRWTAEIYLIFSLGRTDVMPAGDLALQEGLRRLRRMRERPDAKKLTKLAERWRPWRSSAALLLWHFYAQTK